MEHPVTAEEQAEANRFYEAMGRTLGNWAVIEHYMVGLFESVTGLERNVSRKILHSAKSWRGKCDMISAAIPGSGGAIGLEDARLKLLALAHGYSAFRNAIAHRAVRFEPYKPGYVRKLVIVEPGTPMNHEENRYGRPEIEIAGENFILLCALLARTTTLDPKDQEGSPERLSWLATQLPNPPHSTRVDPSIAAQFSRVLGLQSYPK